MVRDRADLAGEAGATAISLPIDTARPAGEPHEECVEQEVLPTTSRSTRGEETSLK